MCRKLKTLHYHEGNGWKFMKKCVYVYMACPWDLNSKWLTSYHSGQICLKVLTKMTLNWSWKSLRKLQSWDKFLEVFVKLRSWSFNLCLISSDFNLEQLLHRGKIDFKFCLDFWAKYKKSYNAKEYPVEIKPLKITNVLLVSCKFLLTSSIICK